MKPTLKVNGVLLDGLGHNITTYTGWRTFPGVRSTAISTSNTDGVLVPNRRLPLEPGALSISMEISGKDYVEFSERLDMLMAVFSTPNGTVPVELNLDPEDGLIRTCQARTLSSWSVTHDGPLHADVSIVMEIPSGTWTTDAYFIERAAYPEEIGTIFVECQNPTYDVIDSILLIRDPGLAVDFRIFDANGDDEYGFTPSVNLIIGSPVASDRSLLFDLGNWTAGLIPRPASEDVDEEWFNELPSYTTTLTSSLDRRGPMYGSSLLSLKPGATPLTPRVPGVMIYAMDASYLPAYIGEAVLALKPRWV